MTKIDKTVHKTIVAELAKVGSVSFSVEISTINDSLGTIRLIKEDPKSRAAMTFTELANGSRMPTDRRGKQDINNIIFDFAEGFADLLLELQGHLEGGEEVDLYGASVVEKNVGHGDQSVVEFKVMETKNSVDSWTFSSDEDARIASDVLQKYGPKDLYVEVADCVDGGMLVIRKKGE